MQELAEVKRSLGADGDRLQGIFVTVDPERDTAEVLKAYMGNFDPSFLACAAALSNWPPSPRTSRSITKGRRQNRHQLHDGSLCWQLRL